MGARPSSSRSCRSGSSLTSPAGMQGQRELRCLIAAGGTAGHVLPSLAVAEALAERGVQVTVAGSPRGGPRRPWKAEGGRFSGLPGAGRFLLGFGGSRGAGLRTELAVGASGPAGPAVLHLSGTRDYDELRPKITRPDYRLFAYT